MIKKYTTYINESKKPKFFNVRDILNEKTVFASKLHYILK